MILVPLSTPLEGSSETCQDKAYWIMTTNSLKSYAKVLKFKESVKLRGT